MLTEIQSQIAKLIAKNRRDDTYFAGGAVLNADTWRKSDDLDIFTDRDEDIPDIVERDISLLRANGYNVTIDLEVFGCAEATIRSADRNAITLIQWMSETRTRFFPLQRDPEWGLRLHMTDLAVNKTIAASTRRQPRDHVDLYLIAQNYVPLGPLFVGAALKFGSRGPGALLENARQRLVSLEPESLASVAGRPADISGQLIKERGLYHLEQAEVFLSEVPIAWAEGLAVDASGVPASDFDQDVTFRLPRDAGGRFPDFPEAKTDFGPT